jgi:hypothetical protein
MVGRPAVSPAFYCVPQQHRNQPPTASARRFRQRFSFIDYYAHIKNAEHERFEKEEPAQGHATVTAWEQKEYLDLF